MKEIILTSRGAVAFVDDQDFDRVNALKWYCEPNGKTKYARHSFFKDGKWRLQYLHRFILGLETVDRRQIDHIDHNGLNCTRSNLRVCSLSENKKNLKSKKNSNGFKGVHFSRRENKYQARILVDGVSYQSKGYKTPEEAHLAYCELAKKHHQEFACFESQ